MYAKTIRVIRTNGDQISQASELGFKCFYVKHKDTKIDKKLFINCPASVEMGKKTSCSLCSLCSGSKRDVVINAHGSTSKYVLVEA